MVKYLTALLLLMCAGVQAQDQQGQLVWPEMTVGEKWAENFLSIYQKRDVPLLIELTIEYGSKTQTLNVAELLQKLQENNPELQEGFQKKGVLGERKWNSTQMLKNFCREVWRNNQYLEAPPYNACPKAAFVQWAKMNGVDISRFETRPYKRRHRLSTGEKLIYFDEHDEDTDEP